MFGKLFGRREAAPVRPAAPEVLGLYLGGSFRVDALRLRLITPHLVIESPSDTHLIQAVGEAPLDHDGSRLLRFYTDDDAFLQVVQSGGRTEQHITDVKLWYFYDTRAVGDTGQWDSLLASLSAPEQQLEGHAYRRVWNAVGDNSPPVAVTETTFSEDGSIGTTDQFLMLYERDLDAAAGEGRTESLLIAGEEKLINQQLDRCVVRSTGFDLSPADLVIV